MRKWLALLLFPLTVQAAGEGAWQDSGMGVTLNYRGVSASSSPLSARQPVSGVMTLVAWRYELNGPTPAGLRVRLCSQSRCVELDGQRARPTVLLMFPQSSRSALSGKSPAAAGLSRR